MFGGEEVSSQERYDFSRENKQQASSSNPSINQSRKEKEVESAERISFNYDQGFSGSSSFCSNYLWSLPPIILTFSTVVGLTITYIMAKHNCHIEKYILPYVSYTGTEYPEYMIFGMIMNLEGFLGSLVVFLAWRYYRHMGQRGWLNRIAFVWGGLSCFGVVMVGNFQVTKAPLPHYVGAGLAFIIGTGYGVLTAILSRKAFRLAKPPLRYGKCMSVLRISLAFFMVIALICLTAVGFYKKQASGKNTKVFNVTTSTNQTESCEDLLSSIPPLQRYLHLFASLAEWFLTFALLICLCLFSYEFQTFHKVKVVLLRHDGPLQCKKSGSSKHFEKLRSTESKSLIRDKRSENGDELKCFREETQDRNMQNCSYCGSSYGGGRFEQVLTSSSLYPVTRDLTTTTADSGIEDNVIHSDYNDLTVQLSPDSDAASL